MPYEKNRSNEVGRQPADNAYWWNTAPKWDVLQRERLANLEEIDLDYRTKPVLVRKDRHFVIYILGMIGLVSLVFTPVASLTGPYLETPFIFALFTATGVIVGGGKFMRHRVKWVALLYALSGSGLWMLALLPTWILRHPLMGEGLFILSLGLTAYLASRIATHYAHWLAASPQLIGEKRKTAQAKWANRQYAGSSIMVLYGMLLIACGGSTLYGLKSYYWLTLVLAVLILYRATRFQKMSETVALCREAIVGWFTYHRYQAVHFDFVEDEGHVGQGSGCLAFFFALVFFGAAFAFLTHQLSFLPKLISVVMLAVFLVVVSVLFEILALAYQQHGTVFPHPVSPHGVFKSPGGSWIRRNLVTIATLGTLFVSSLLYIPYAPVGLVASDSRPLLAAFHRVVENKFSFSWVLAYLDQYEPPTAARIVEQLSTAEVRWLKSIDLVSQQEYVLTKQAAHYLHLYPRGWVTLMLDSAFLGHVHAVWALLFTLIHCLIFPVLLFFLACLAVFGRELRHYVTTLDALKSPVTDWQGYVERLRQSEVAMAREHLWLGTHATEDYPVLLHRAILREHAHFLGDSGSGKTALGIAPLITQLIREKDSAVVVIDLKGDMPLFQNVRHEAGTRLKFFSNEVGKATHVFHPFASLSSDHISLNQVCEVFLSAMGLDYGEGYGRSYYSRVARNLLSRTLHEYPDIASFEELREKVGKLVDTQKDEKDVFELIAVVESLAAVPQLNYTAKDRVGEHGIDMAKVLKDREVVYFWLPAATETASVREIAKIALYTLFNSAYQHQRQERQAAKVWVFIDEFQHVASLNFKLLLQQARSMGIGMILANQSDSDLWTQDADLKGTVQTNTRFKQVFAVSNIQEREAISRASGETLYYSGRMDGASERVGPRLTTNDLIAFSDEPDTSIVLIGRGEGYSQFGGYAFPLRSDYHITFEEYAKRKTAPWPDPSAETLVAQRKRRTEVRPDAASLSTAYILSEDEPPPRGQRAGRGFPLGSVLGNALPSAQGPSTQGCRPGIGSVSA